MAYERLPFEQYFINTSEDHNKTGRATREIKYRGFIYSGKGLAALFRIRHEMNYEIHYEQDRDVIQLNFQKTAGFTDWFANIVEFSSKYYDAITFRGRPLQLRVHHGWGDMYRSIKRIVRAEWQALKEEHPDAETEILGWSLGSGLAILCCQDLNYNFGLKSHLFTFGSVRPFKSVLTNDRKMRRYLSTCCTECWNFADVNDIVTYMPPFKGFMMINRVEVSKAPKRTLRNLLHPLIYHTRYDDPVLYRRFENTGEKGEENL